MIDLAGLSRLAERTARRDRRGGDAVDRHGAMVQRISRDDRDDSEDARLIRTFGVDSLQREIGGLRNDRAMYE